MPIDWFPLWLSLRVAGLATRCFRWPWDCGSHGCWPTASFAGRKLLDAAVTLPLVLPPTVLGYYLLVVLGRMSPIGQMWETVFGRPLVFTWQAAVAASIVHALPLLVKSARAALESVDRSYEKRRATWAPRSGACSGA